MVPQRCAYAGHRPRDKQALRGRLSPAGPLLRSLASLASPAAGQPHLAAPAMSVGALYESRQGAPGDRSRENRTYGSRDRAESVNSIPNPV
jgi:hypothetical protein